MMKNAGKIGLRIKNLQEKDAFSLKNILKLLAGSEKSRTFAPAIGNNTVANEKRRVL